MPGRGPAPKSPERRAGHGKGSQFTVLHFTPAERQELPDDLLEADEMWHPATIRWWQRWLDSPLSAEWTDVDWSELEVAALTHHQFMKKRSFTLAAELRQRVAKFGATPRDRADLRIMLATADEKDDKRSSRVGQSARARYGGASRAVASD